MLRWKQIIIFTGPALTSVCIVAVTLSCNRIIREFLRNSSIPVDYRLMTSESRGLRIRYQCFLKGTHRPLRRQSNEWTIKCVWWCCFVAKSGPILCEPTDCSPPGPSVHGFPRQEYWRGWPFPSPGDLPDPGTEPSSPTLASRPLPLSHQESSYVWFNQSKICHVCIDINQLERLSLSSALVLHITIIKVCPG